MVGSIVVLSLLLIAGFLIAPNLRRRNGPALEAKLFAHRGLHDNSSDAPENSMKAFEQAAEAGYGIELDVRWTKDERLIVFHDDTLSRLCGDTRPVVELAYDELQSFHLLKTNERIPDFADVLSLVAGRVPLLVEIKYTKDVTRLTRKVADALEGYRGEFLIESFAPQALLALRKYRPGILRGQLVGKFSPEGPLASLPLRALHANLALNFLSRPDFIAYDHHMNGGVILWIMRHIFATRLAAWTIRSQAEMEPLKTHTNQFIFEGFDPKLD